MARSARPADGQIATAQNRRCRRCRTGPMSPRTQTKATENRNPTTVARTTGNRSRPEAPTLCGGRKFFVLPIASNVRKLCGAV